MTIDDLAWCFEGIYPSVLATRGPDGMPNVTYLSHVARVDDGHVAISNQFFAKTAANLRSDPRATLQLVDPRDGAQYHLRLTWSESLDCGPLFERMKAQLSASSAQVGLADVMRLRAVDVLRVDDICAVRADLADAADRASARDLPALPVLAAAIARLSAPTDSSRLICDLLDIVHVTLGYRYAMILLAEADREVVTVAAAIGYGAVVVVGAEVAFGDGLIGGAARSGHSMRINDLSSVRRMGCAVVDSSTGDEIATREVALPGAPDAMSQIAVPMIVQGQLQGILFVESDRRLAFDATATAPLEVLSSHMASLLALNEQAAVNAEPEQGASPRLQVPDGAQQMVVVHHGFDQSIFIDNAYVIKGLAGRLLAYMLARYRDDSQEEFSNRELRLAMASVLPDFKDNLETRLLLLRRRLDDLDLPIRLHHIARGRLKLGVTGSFVLSHEQ